MFEYLLTEDNKVDQLRSDKTTWKVQTRILIKENNHMAMRRRKIMSMVMMADTMKIKMKRKKQRIMKAAIVVILSGIIGEQIISIQIITLD